MALNNKDQRGGSRLTRDDWVAGAFGMLAKNGIDGLRVEKLAQSLKVTKGSFYWHFKDREELCDAVLEKWRQLNTYELIDHVGQRRDPIEQLRELVRAPFEISLDKSDGTSVAGSSDIALSLRLWARTDRRVAKVLREVDMLRTRAFAQLFIAAGFPEEQAHARGIILYSYMRTAMSLLGRDADALKQQCEALLIGLPSKPLKR